MKKNISKMILSGLLTSTMLMGSATSIFADDGDLGSGKVSQLNTVIEQITTDAETDSKARATAITVNDKAYDKEYEENEYIEEATYLAYPTYYSNRISAVINDLNKKEHGGEDWDFFSFTMYSSSDPIAVTLDVPDGSDYDLYVMDADGWGWASERGGSSNEILRIYPPASGSQRYYVLVKAYGDSNPTAWYRLELDKLYATSSYTSTLSPSILTNPGNSDFSLDGVYSNIGTVNLSNVAAIPNDARVTGVTSIGKLNKNIGNTKIEVSNNYSGIWHSSILSSTGTLHTIPDFKNNDDYVKSQWFVRYHTLAGMASTYGPSELKIDYYYDQYAGY